MERNFKLAERILQVQSEINDIHDSKKLLEENGLVIQGEMPLFESRVISELNDSKYECNSLVQKMKSGKYIDQDVLQALDGDLEIMKELEEIENVSFYFSSRRRSPLTMGIIHSSFSFSIVSLFGLSALVGLSLFIDYMPNPTDLELLPAIPSLAAINSGIKSYRETLTYNNSLKDKISCKVKMLNDTIYNIVSQVD